MPFTPVLIPHGVSLYLIERNLCTERETIALIIPNLEDRQVLVKTFHPDWETIEKSFWIKRMFLILFGSLGFGLYIWIGYTLPGSQMPLVFANNYPVRIIEFILWYFSTMWYVEMYLIARHKAKTTEIKWKISKNEEMHVSLVFNRAFGRLFLTFYIFYLLRLAFTFEFNFNLPNCNIYEYLRGYCTLFETVYAAIVTTLGFIAYSFFLYSFEKTVMGRKYPLFWIIPPIGVALMIFVPYDLIVFTIPLYTGLAIPIHMYEFSLIIGWLGGMFVPILYFIMSKRFAYGNAATAKDCWRKGIGFLLLAIAAINSINLPFLISANGGILYVLQVFFFAFLGGILTFAGIWNIRTAYRPRG